MFEIERITRDLREVVAGLDPACLAGRDAARLTEVAAEGEKLFGAAKALLAKRAADTNAWRSRSHAASPEQWLAKATGSTEHAARETFATTQRLRELPATEEQLRNGELSLQQAAHVTAGAAADPSAERQLLNTAKRSGMRELRNERERVIAGAADEVEARRRAKRDRHLRTFTEGFATRGTFSGPTEEVAKLLGALEPLEQTRFETARRSGEHEAREAYRFDALIDLAESGANGTKPKTVSNPTGTVIVGLGSLLDGKVRPGETCEIPGVGPVPVAHARDVLSHGLLQLVITNGVDVQTVVSPTRHVPQALKIAIAVRDRSCKIRGCDRTIGLHRHHTEPFGETHRTTYAELGLVCDQHHHLIHDRDHTIEDHHDGTWSLRAPPGQAAA
jgi:hypothetical protein